MEPLALERKGTANNLEVRDPMEVTVLAEPLKARKRGASGNP